MYPVPSLTYQYFFMRGANLPNPDPELAVAIIVTVLMTKIVVDILANKDNGITVGILPSLHLAPKQDKARCKDVSLRT